MAGGRSGRDLNVTPTWAVALVSAVIVLISILLEKLLHGIGKTFERKKKKALGDALEKIKGELMVLGFISLLLTFGQNYIARICIPEKIANTMLPCPLPESLKHGDSYHPPVDGGHGPPSAEGDHGPPAAEGDHGPPSAEGDHGPPSAEGDHGPPAAEGDHGPPAAEGGHGPPAGEGGHGPPAGKGDQGPPAGKGDHGPPAEGGSHPLSVEGDNDAAVKADHLLSEVNGQGHAAVKGQPPPEEEGSQGHPAVKGHHHSKEEGGHSSKVLGEPPPTFEGTHRRLLWYERRSLAADSEATACKKGRVPVISINGLHQLHIFIFFLAVFHVVFGAITMNLGRLKIRGWKDWERQAAREEEKSNDASRFRLTHETSFVRDNTRYLATSPVLVYLVCFYRQFFRSVRKADYLTMRHGFISVHLAPGSKFDFQKYIKRSLEDDFKVVVGISPPLWGSAVLFLLLNVYGWQIMLWLSVLPLVSILAIGTKLQAIITQMAVEIQERHAVVQGIPLVHVSDKHFWFGKPQFILHLIHFTLFQNAFEITYFIWITYEYGLHSCFHENFKLSVLRMVVGVAVQVVCSYITLPLYALVTQMGSNIKKSVFDDHTNKALSKWTMQAKKKKPAGAVGGKGNAVQTRKLGDHGSPEGSPERGSPRGSRLEMTNVQTATAANITASVDIPDESPPADHDDNNNASSRSRNVQFPDLLTGP